MSEKKCLKKFQTKFAKRLQIFGRICESLIVLNQIWPHKAILTIKEAIMKEKPGVRKIKITEKRQSETQITFLR